MAQPFEQINPEIFDWLENRPFRNLSASERQEVLKYLSEEEYDDMHSAAFFIRKSISAGSTSAYLPVRNDLLDTFDRRYPKKTVTPLNMLWKIAAVFLLFAAGWLCHYLTAYKQSPSSLVAGTDTVYIMQEGVRIYDTVFIEKQDSQPVPGSPKTNGLHLKENRDATELVPEFHLPRRDSEEFHQRPGTDRHRHDSLPKPADS